MKKNTSSGDCNIVTYKIKKKKKIKYSLAKCNFCYIKKILYILNVGLFWSINCAFYCNLRVNVIIQQLHLPRGLQSNNFHDQSLRQLLFTQKKDGIWWKWGKIGICITFHSTLRFFIPYRLSFKFIHCASPWEEPYNTLASPFFFGSAIFHNSYWGKRAS